jgi:magnesium transporter
MKQPEAHYTIITPSGGFEEMPTLKEALAYTTSQNGYIWADYVDPTAELLAELMPALGIHPLSIEDCINGDQLPKLDLFPNYSFLIFNTFEETPEDLLSHELDLFIGENFVVTAGFRREDNQALLTGLRELLERQRDVVRQGPSYLLHQVLDKTVDEKLGVIENIEEALEANEDAILAEPLEFDYSSLMQSRRALQVMRRSLFHEREVVNKLIRRDSPFITEKALVYFRDIYDHLSKYYEVAEAAREQVTDLMEIHLSLINNSMAETANRTNAIMRRLTLITTIFMPLTLIAGIGGMSEFTMIVGQDNWGIAYFVLLVVMAVIGLINYRLLLRMERDANEDGKKLQINK